MKRRKPLLNGVLVLNKNDMYKNKSIINSADENTVNSNNEKLIQKLELKTVQRNRMIFRS